MNSFLNQFPYSDFHEMNLDWILKEVKRIAAEMHGFEAANSVNYAGIWNITQQYTAWSIVLDQNTSNMMIALQPVPVGIAITNSDYWLLVAPFKVDVDFSNTSYNAIANKTVKDKFDSVDNSIEGLDSALSTERGRIDQLTTDLSNETAARIAADNTLTSGLASESEARISAVNTLTGRIDSLAHLEEGSTTGDAELIDGRTGYNGITYNSIGDAIRSQVADLHDEAEYICANNLLYPYDPDILYLTIAVPSNSYLFDFRTYYSRLTGVTKIDFGDGTEITSFTETNLKHNYTGSGTYVIKIYGCTAIDNLGFRSLAILKKAVIPKTVTSIGTMAFSENDAALEVYISGDSVAITNSNAFYTAVTIYVLPQYYLTYYYAWDKELTAAGNAYQVPFLREKIKTFSPDIAYYDNEVTVGSGGDFDTLTEAISYLSQFYPVYIKGGINCTVTILSGTTISEQIYVEKQDLQFITILAEDAYVPVDATYFDTTANAHDARGNVPFFAGENAAKLPTIGCLFRLTVEQQEEKTVCGLLANRGSECVILPDSGFEYFYDGIISNNESSVTIREGICRHITRYALHARHNGEISARSADITYNGVAAIADRIADLDVREAVFDHSTQCIICYNVSRVCSNATSSGSAENCGNGTDPLIDVRSGGKVVISQMDLQNSASDICYIADGGIIVAKSIDTT